jgi:hypothetical protein
MSRSPQAYANAVLGRFRSLTRRADITGFHAFADGDDYALLLLGAGARYRYGLQRAYFNTLEEIESRARVVKPKGLGESRVRWTPAALDKLRAAYAEGLDDAAVGRKLGVSTGSARLARKLLPPRKLQDGQSAAPLPQEGSCPKSQSPGALGSATAQPGRRHANGAANARILPG